MNLPSIEVEVTTPKLKRLKGLYPKVRKGCKNLWRDCGTGSRFIKKRITDSLRFKELSQP